MEVVADGAGTVRKQRRQCAGGNRPRHGSIWVGEETEFLGWSVSWQQPHRRQEHGEQDHQREPLAARRAHRVRLGSFQQEELLSEREILAAGDQKTPQAAGYHGDSAHPAGALLSGPKER